MEGASFGLGELLLPAGHTLVVCEVWWDALNNSRGVIDEKGNNIVALGANDIFERGGNWPWGIAAIGRGTAG
jgi:hypothetical protein